MQKDKIRNIVEAALLAAGRPLTLDQIAEVFGIEAPDRSDLQEAVDSLRADYESRGIMLAEVASGYRVQVRSNMADWVSRLWEERPPRYSRALMETLALIAYRQPITRAEIEEIRGVSVSTNIIRTLGERNWIRVLGHRDVPGKPAMYGTTREFLDYFGLKKLDELPPLSELRDFDQVNPELALESTEQALPAVALEAPSAEAGTDSDADAEPEGGARQGENVVAQAGGSESVEDSSAADEPAPSESDDSGNVVPLKKPGSA